MNIGDYISRYLETNGVEYLFGVPAGTTGPLWNSMNDTNIIPIITKNEAGSVYSATNYADITDKLGVVLLAGGVGINNAINGIADAYRRKVPVLIISGYVNRKQIGKGAIQELNTELVTKPITKYSETILEEEGLLDKLKSAMEIALTAPYGPVHIAIPMDLQKTEIDIEMPSVLDKERLVRIEDNKLDIEEAVNIINNSQKGLIFVGKGCKLASKEVMELSEKLNWNLVTTPQAKGVVSTDFRYNLGAYGFSGTELATKYVEEDDIECVLVLGSSLGESSTRNYNDVLVKNRKVIHVDWDKEELNKVFKADVAINDSVENVLKCLLDRCNSKDKTDYRQRTFNSPYECNHSGLSTRLFLEKLPHIMPEGYHLISDIGEYMNFVIRNLEVPSNTGFTISLNYGAMGVGIGGSVGVALANKGNTTAVVVGDGSFFMNGTEILTAKEYKLPIVYFVINNAMLGYVEHGQKFIYGRSIEGVKQQRISIADVAQAMGIKSMQITDIKELDKCKEIISSLSEPLVVELVTDGTEIPIAADRFKALKNN